MTWGPENRDSDTRRKARGISGMVTVQSLRKQPVQIRAGRRAAGAEILSSIT